ncbi:hypothetical protein [Mariprofundus sp. NF]|uniref:hypothetical protein n=1 Tax=Mariprofundus sp. NF TaxID=2608716 RepID=UPI0015A364C2|nr:hypothetical protein [Mariprofundus sp. NF]
MMDGIRAKKIADRFSGNLNFIVHSYSGGLLVRYHQHTHYFVRESCFWSYVYRAAGLPIGHG